MTNMERIKRMDEKELAELLVKETIQQDVDYDWDESPFAIYETVYELPTTTMMHSKTALNGSRRTLTLLQKYNLNIAYFPAMQVINGGVLACRPKLPLAAEDSAKICLTLLPLV